MPSLPATSTSAVVARCDQNGGSIGDDRQPVLRPGEHLVRVGLHVIGFVLAPLRRAEQREDLRESIDVKCRLSRREPISPENCAERAVEVREEPYSSWPNSTPIPPEWELQWELQWE
ncbi:MAG: hypothetical protein JWL61_700 [Gemmatimonadetes bacterium]|nr:hypothetical protein [Gemmatimonadota bacterium]